MTRLLEGHFHLRRGAFELQAELELPTRGITGIFGDSGCGKTTLLRCLSGLERADDGRLTVEGITWQDESQGHFLPPYERAVGMVFQESRLFSHLNVKQNLCYGMKRKHPNGTRLSFDDVVSLLGIDPLLERRPERLSGGEQQRVAIGRALLTQPRLLLMDEPLAGLDRTRKSEVMPFLERMHRELAVPILYVSHSLDEITSLVDHLLLMEGGRSVASGPLDEMLTRLDLSLADDAQATTVVSGSVAGIDEHYKLMSVDTPFGPLLIPKGRVAVGDGLRLKIQARDVSLCLTRPEKTSIINIFPARIVDVDPTHKCHVNIRLEAGGAHLLSRVSHKSREQLGLEPGLELFVQVKGIAMEERG
jgi:molybdate transport system ATP-binding protein